MYPVGDSSVEPWISSMQIPLDDTAANSIKKAENRSITAQKILHFIKYYTWIYYVYKKTQVAGPFPGPCASGSYMHRAALFLLRESS